MITLIKSKIIQILDMLGYQLLKKTDKYQLAIYSKCYTELEIKNKPFYNVGAGSFFHPFWTNIDYISDWYKDIQKNVVHFDLMSLTPLPIKSNSAKIIYSSHTIEHISEEAVQNFFNECYRSLENGGILRVVTGPDAHTDFRALMGNDENWFYWDNNYKAPGSYEHIYKKPATEVPLSERWLHHVASELCENDKSEVPKKFNNLEILAVIDSLGFEGALDYFTSLCRFNPDRPGNHITWWTHEKVTRFLKKAGFLNIYRSGQGQSASPVMRTPLFDSTHPQISLYIEAKK